MLNSYLQRTGNAEVTGSNPVEALIFFRLLLSSCLNWKIHCDDHSSLLSHSLTNWLYTFQSYLSEKGLVHRDLAARNILVGHGKKLKIGDFGLMREMYHELYEVKKQKKLPIKWMAPEAIYEQIFTSKSDVYVLFLTYNTADWSITPI